LKIKEFLFKRRYSGSKITFDKEVLLTAIQDDKAQKNTCRVLKRSTGRNSLSIDARVLKI